MTLPPWAWPDVRIARVRAIVLQNAVLTAASIALSYVLDPIWLFATGHALFATPPVEGADLVTLAATSAVLALVTATLAWSLWRAPTRMAAALLVGVCAFQVGESLLDTPPAYLTAALWAWGWFYAMHGYRAAAVLAPVPAQVATRP